MRWLLTATVLGACGRIDFDPRPSRQVETGALALGWAQGFGSSTSDIGNGVTVDPAGNVVIGGYLDDSAAVGGDLLVGQPFTVFAASFDPSGSHRWSRAFGGGVVRLGMASDETGIYLSGGHSGTINFGGPSYTTTSEKPFVAALDHDGGFRWSFRASGAFIMTSSLAVGGGVVAITGDGDGNTWNFGGADLVQSAIGSFEQFIAAYRTADGGHLWSRRVGSPNFFTTRGDGIVLASDGSGWVVGGSGGMVDFGAGPVAPGPGSQDGTLVRFAATGTPTLAKWLGHPGTGDRALAIALEPAGSAVVAGALGGPADFGGGVLAEKTFIAAFDPGGEHRWSRALLANLTHIVLARGPRFTYFASTFSGAIDLGTGVLVSAGGTDCVIAAFDEGGTPVWAERFGGAGDDQIEAIALAPDGTLYATGAFSGIAEVQSTTLTSNGESDVFVAAFDPVFITVD